MSKSVNVPVDESVRVPVSSKDWPDDQALLQVLDPWLRQRRWFPLKGAAAPAPGQLRVAACVELAAAVRELVVSVPRGDDAKAAPVFLHVPLVLDEAGALERLAMPGEAPGNVGVRLGLGANAPDLEGSPGGLALVEGAHHPAYWRAWAGAAIGAQTVLNQQEAQAIIQRADRLRVLLGEQSNTSVVLPAPLPDETMVEAADAATGDLIVKVLRVLEPGRNPDIEVSVALAQAGWERVRRPVAWSTVPLPGGVVADAALACAFVPAADDGFELFCALAGQDGGPGSQARARATELAGTLGVTTAQMHMLLAQTLGVEPALEAKELAGRLQEQARWALQEVPQLVDRLPTLPQGVAEVYARLAELGALPEATRVHGDYHLGQVLLAHATAEAAQSEAAQSGVAQSGVAQSWYVLDFEGEPLRPLAQRLERDQPLRDVAGMLRSFDYAAAMGQAPYGDWLGLVRQAFMSGYTRTLPLAVADPILLTALELDKALYEAVYEARSRPAWFSIPVAGLERLLSR